MVLLEQLLKKTTENTYPIIDVSITASVSGDFICRSTYSMFMFNSLKFIFSFKYTNNNFLRNHNIYNRGDRLYPILFETIWSISKGKSTANFDHIPWPFGDRILRDLSMSTIKIYKHKKTKSSQIGKKLIL